MPEPLAPPSRLTGPLLYSAAIPPPPSVNALFFNRRAPQGGQRGRGRTTAYRKWLDEAGAMLLAQGPRPECQPPVAVLIDLGDDCGSRIDTDNASKAVLDLLVKHEIIPDDSPKVVRHCSATWGPGSVCRVHVLRWIE